jgi:O-antigen ligase
MLNNNRALIPQQSAAIGSERPETATVRHRRFHRRTTRVERLLLAVTIILLPLQDHIPDVAGFSIMWIMFGVLAIYVLVNRAGTLAVVWLHPVFLTAFGFLYGMSLLEFLHPDSSYSEIVSIASMFVGAIFVAALCRDRRALQTAIYGYIGASLWLGILLFMTSYGALSGAAATNFQEASRIRDKVITANPLQGNANAMAAQAGQGAAGALALGLKARGRRRRYLLLGITLFCLVASFLPMSRGAVALVVVSCATVLVASGVRLGKIAIAASIIGVAMTALIPDAVWSRMTFSTQATRGKLEGRAQVYSAALEGFPEYALTGVGVGNFWKSWGFDHGFRYHSGVLGAHNGFFQVTIYWGLPGLLALIAVVWQAHCCLPRHCRYDALALSLLGLSVSLLMILMVRHVLYAKEFSLGLGLLVGSRCWIWPRGIVPSAPWGQRRFRLSSGWTS